MPTQLMPTLRNERECAVQPYQQQSAVVHSEELFYLKHQTSPLGALHLVATQQLLLCVAFDAQWSRMSRKFFSHPHVDANGNSLLQNATNQIDEYLRGQRMQFELPFEFRGSEFQKRVWHSLMRIPFAETMSYRQQAELLGRPNAVRAVANANRFNPLCIVVPCHRVIAHSGALSGYVGGVEVKAALLQLERSLDLNKTK